MKPAPPSPLWQRLAWFAALWLGSILALGSASLVIRWLLRP